MFNVEACPEPLIDIGVNLTHESFQHDLDRVIARAESNNVTQMVITGSDLAESRAAINLARLQPQRFYATAGVHPHYADQFDQQTAIEIDDLAGQSEVRAVGETGLDFFRDISPRKVQQQCFIDHIGIAIKYSKPMFLHQRDAHPTFLAILREHRASLSDVVVHCFTDTAEALQDYLDLDCHIGITGWICDERRGSHLLDCVNQIPLQRLMIETDAPYLMPRNLKPKPKTRRNEPCTLPCVLRAIAAVREESEMDIANATRCNAQRFFGLS